MAKKRDNHKKNRAYELLEKSDRKLSVPSPLIIKEVTTEVMVNCQYCGALMKVTSIQCSNCGAYRKR